MAKSNRSNFPGARKPPVRQEESEAPTGRRGRARRGRLTGKSTPDRSPESSREGSFAPSEGRFGNKGPKDRFQEREGGAPPRGGEVRRGSGGEAGHSGGEARRGGLNSRRGERGGKRFGGRDDRQSSDTRLILDDSDLSFSDLVMQLARRAAPDKVQGGNHPEPLARLDYDQELDIKNRALQEFWTAHGLPDKPNKILPSPRPRGYRTTTKRRVVSVKGGYELTFLTESISASTPKAGQESLVEPREHKAIYAFMLSKLNTPAYANLAGALNYLIIRGGYETFTVLFNVHRLNADVVRKAKMLGEHLKGLETPKVISAFMFYDPSKSDFYFEARSPEGPWKIKKIYGPDDIHLKVLNRTYAFHPTAFCQVNASILPLFLEKADQLLKPKPEYRLLDMYSGFGFFTLHLGASYGEALGVDMGQASIESGQRMAAADPSAHCRFRAGRISLKNLEKLLPAATGDKPEVLLLDPPRQGCDPGIIRALAARNPARILHIFCDLDTLPKEVNQWRKSGFMVSKVVPLDMFPGTDNLEVMVLFIPDRYGILNRIDKSRTELREEGDPEIDLPEVEEAEPSKRGFIPGRAAGAKKTDRPKRSDHYKPTGRFGKPKRTDADGSAEESLLPDNNFRSERPARPSRKNRVDGPSRTIRTEHPSGPDRAEGPARPSRKNRTDAPFRPDRTGGPKRSGGPQRTGGPKRSEGPSRPASGPGSGRQDRPQRRDRKPRGRNS